MAIFNNSLIKWRYHWFISLKTWLIVLHNKGLIDWIFLFCLNFFYCNDTTTLNNNWRVVEGKHDILGDSRNYPHQTMNSFLKFRGQGRGRVFELEIQRHQGITHFGNSDGKRRLNYESCPRSCPWYGTDIFWSPPFYPHLKGNIFFI